MTAARYDALATLYRHAVYGAGYNKRYQHEVDEAYKTMMEELDRLAMLDAEADAHSGKAALKVLRPSCGCGPFNMNHEHGCPIHEERKAEVLRGERCGAGFKGCPGGLKCTSSHK